MKQYDTYKDSGIEWIGEIPSHWQIVPIKYSLSVPLTDGPHETPELVADGVTFISAEAIKEDKIDFDKKRGYISIEDHERFSKKYKPQIGDVYMVKSGATTGNLARVQTNHEFNIWSPLAAFRPDIQTTFSDFLFFFMKSKRFFTAIELGWNYGTQQNIGMNVLENLRMVRPPLSEQTAIATYLDRKTAEIDTLIADKKRLLELYEEEKTAIINQAVTKGLDPNAKMKDSGIEWLGEIPEHWEVKRFKYYFDLITEKVEGNLPKIGLENIESKSGKFIETDSEFAGQGIRFNPQDVLFGKLRPYLAKVWLAYFDGQAVGDFYVFRTKSNLIPEYAKFRILDSSFIEVANSSTYGSKMPRVSWEFIADLRIAFPATEGEQQSIVQHIETECARINAKIAKTEKLIDLLIEYRTALISEVVTGKVKVIE